MTTTYRFRARRKDDALTTETITTQLEMAQLNFCFRP